MLAMASPELTGATSDVLSRESGVFATLGGSHGRVFADSHAAVAAMRLEGLPEDTPIWTSAPALHLNPEIPTRQVDALGEDGFARLAEVTATLAQAIYGVAAANVPHPNLAFALARIPLVEEHLLYRGMMLRDEDLLAPCVIAEARFDGDSECALALRTNPCWAELLPEDGASAPIRFPYLANPPGATSLPGQVDVRPGLLARLKFEPGSSLVYRAAKEVGSLVPESVLPRICWLLGVSPLGKEVSSHLLAKGYVPRLLRAEPAAADDVQEQASEIAKIVIAETGDEIVAALCKIVIRPVAERIRQALALAIEEAALSYCRWKKGWRDRLSGVTASPRHQRAILAYDMTPGGLAAAVALEEADIPFCIGQHGVTNEVRTAIPSADLTFEAAAGGLFCAYGPESARHAEASTYARARCEAVGASADMAPRTRQPCRAARSQILYVSTGLYLANRQRPSLRGISDLALAEHEIRVIDDIFSGLGSGVVYKTYPYGNRYLDPDPVIARARAAAKIELVEQDVDVRYMLSQFGMIVMARATSTFGWCLASGKPLVLLDHPAHNPYRQDLRPLLSDALFFVDLSAPGGFEAARDLLSQPSQHIEAQWQGKRPARERLVRLLLGDLNGHAGRRAAETMGRGADRKV